MIGCPSLSGVSSIFHQWHPDHWMPSRRRKTSVQGVQICVRETTWRRRGRQSCKASTPGISVSCRFHKAAMTLPTVGSTERFRAATASNSNPRRPEAQTAAKLVVRKGTHNDASMSKALEGFGRRVDLRQAEQGSAANDLNVRFRQQPIELLRDVRQPIPRGIHPRAVRERALTNRERNRSRPRTETAFSVAARCGAASAKPNRNPAGRRIYRTTSARRCCRGRFRRRGWPLEGRHHECLVHDEVRPGFSILRRKQPVFCDNPPIRIVWIGDDDQVGAVKLLDICCFRDLVSGKGGGRACSE